MKNKNAAVQTISLALTAGMRAMMAPALAINYLCANKAKEIERSSFGFINTPVCKNATIALSLIELLGDKLPGVPDRINTGGVIARGTSGALVGAMIYKVNKERALTGLLLGGAVAVAATYGSFYLRKALGNRTGVADKYIAIAEDALAIAAASLAFKNG